MIDYIINEIAGKTNIILLGFGREGKSTYKLIRNYLPTKKLTIADSNNNLLNDNPELKKDNYVSIVTGEKYLNNLDHYDMIIKSPGINFKHIEYDLFKDKITSQIDLFLRHTNCKTIGVTGTKGKSTTASLIYHILQELKIPSVLAGNIGIPVFERLSELTEETIVVLELSCHQLQFVKSSPNISILLNIYEEHLDLYKSYEDYVLAKLNIFNYQKEKDYNIWGIDSAESNKRINYNKNTYVITFDKDKSNCKNKVYLSDKGLFLHNDLIYSLGNKRLLIGKHNLYNIGVAIAVSDILNLNMEKVVFAINTFKPLEHRMEYVGKYRNIDFYNDSISTIPETAINCMKSIPNLDTIIIGGMNREIDLTPLTNYINSVECLVRNFILLPDTGHMIKDKIINKNKYIVNDMKDAVKKAYEVTKSGNACALSPAAASYHQYKNFEERGKDYKRLIVEISNNDQN